MERYNYALFIGRSWNTSYLTSNYYATRLHRGDSCFLRGYPLGSCGGCCSSCHEGCYSCCRLQSDWLTFLSCEANVRALLHG
jgi:hypothetical protein